MTALRRVAIYARVSTAEQNTDNQLLELRGYVEARGWTGEEFVDHGISGSKDRRPALDALTVAVRRHQVDAVVCWRLDRLGRNLRHLVMLLDDWHARGIAFVTLGEESTRPRRRAVSSRVSSGRLRSSSERASRSESTLVSHAHVPRGSGLAGPA